VVDCARCACHVTFVFPDPMHACSWRPISNIGFENVVVQSGWKWRSEPFVHHASQMADYGWQALMYNVWPATCDVWGLFSALAGLLARNVRAPFTVPSFRECVLGVTVTSPAPNPQHVLNGWVRNVVFDSLNCVARFDTCMNVVAVNNRLMGKQVRGADPHVPCIALSFTMRRHEHAGPRGVLVSAELRQLVPRQHGPGRRGPVPRARRAGLPFMLWGQEARCWGRVV
jgi:hypothetical protein